LAPHRDRGAIIKLPSRLITYVQKEGLQRNRPLPALSEPLSGVGNIRECVTDTVCYDGDYCPWFEVVRDGDGSVRMVGQEVMQSVAVEVTVLLIAG
jgi:hypothetical protein